jgi:cytochrome P450
MTVEGASEEPGPPNLADLDITSTRPYATRGCPWAAWDLLRRDAPVHRFEPSDYEPFWAITRHADVLTVSKRPDIFTNMRRLRLFSREEDVFLTQGLRLRAIALGWDPDEPIDLVFMDDPRHRAFRSLTARSFTPGFLRRWEPRMRELAADFGRELDAALTRDAVAGGATNLVVEFSAKLPQAIICEMLGLPRDDWPALLRWTNAMVGAPDAEFLRPGEALIPAMGRAAAEARDYFLSWIERNRREGVPRGITSQLLAGEIGGCPLTEQQLQGYFLLLTAAGSETTRNAITGGVHALLNHREELARLEDDPALLPTAVEEILRWTSPVIQFARTAVADFELAGVRIRARDDVAMFYPSANRDEAVFAHPYRFDVGRTPNQHLAFGYGPHFCLGANLARLELRVMLEELLPRLSHLEGVGQPELVPHLHVGGIRSLRLRTTGART